MSGDEMSVNRLVVQILPFCCQELGLSPEFLSSVSRLLDKAVLWCFIGELLEFSSKTFCVQYKK